MEPILKAYKRNFTTEFVTAFVVPDSGRQTMGCNVEILLRDDEQHIVIEQVTIPPKLKVPLHRHPNVSVIDFGILGSGAYSVNGHYFYNSENDRHPLPLYVPRGAPHGGMSGERGAKIVSFQYWYQWPPKESLFLDWEPA